MAIIYVVPTTSQARVLQVVVMTLFYRGKILSHRLEAYRDQGFTQDTEPGVYAFIYYMVPLYWIYYVVYQE